MSTTPIGNTMIREPVNKIFEEYSTEIVLAIILSILVAATVEFIFQVDATNILGTILLIPILLYLMESALLGSIEERAKSMSALVQLPVVVVPIFLVTEHYTINSPVGSLLFVGVIVISFLFIIKTQEKLQNLLENALSRVAEPQ